MAIASANGDISLKVSATGAGGVPRVVDQTADALKKTGTEAKKSTEAAGTFGEKLKGLKSSFSGLNTGREVFENIKSNLMFLPGLASSLVETFVDIAQAIGTTKTAQDQFRESLEKTAKAVEAVRGRYLDNLDQTDPNAANRLRGVESSAKAAQAYAELAVSIIKQRRVIDAAIKERESSTDPAVWAEQTRIVKDAYQSIASSEALYAASLQSDADLTKQRTKDIIASLDAFRQSADAMRGLVTFSAQLRSHWSSIAVSAGVLAGFRKGVANTNSASEARSFFNTFGQRIAADGTGETAGRLVDKPAGGARKKREGGLFEGLGADDFVSRAARRKRERDEHDARTSIRLDDNGDSLGDVRIETADIQAKFTENVEEQKLAALNEQLVQFRDTIASLAPELGGFGDSMMAIADIWAKWGQSGKNTSKAIVGSLGEIAKAGAAHIKEEQLRAGILSIIEFGLGWASYGEYDYGAAAAHWTASAVLAGTAIFGGGSGSSAGKSGNGVSGSRANVPRVGGGDAVASGNVTLIINGGYYGAHGAQEAAASFNALLRRNAGNGYSRAA